MIESNQAAVEEVLRSYQTFTLLKVLALKYTYSINCKMTVIGVLMFKCYSR